VEGVGDSPRGPLKQQGNPCLKHATAHAGHSPRRGGPQRLTKEARSKIPSSRLRLARGCAPPSNGLRPVRGGALTSSRLRLA
jgi:hypothetical protein